MFNILMDSVKGRSILEGLFEGKSERRAYIEVFLIIIVTSLFYIPAFRAAFIWDDALYITGNRFLHTLDGLKSIWLSRDGSHQYYPLVSTTFWLEWRLFGTNPVGYHIVNVALHSINGVLLWLAVRRLSIKGALVIALVFTLHPINVESVAWITERKNLLSALFYFAALLSFIRFDDKSSRRFYFLSLLFFLLALFSKTVACSLPVAIIIIYWWREVSINRALLIRLLPFFILGAFMGLYTAWCEVSEVGAAGADWSLGFDEKFVLAGRAVWFYLGKLIVPYKLTFIYPRFDIASAGLFSGFYTVLAGGVLVVLYVLRGAIGRAPAAAYALFLVTIFPALGFFDIYFFRFSFVADHFLYLATPAAVVFVIGLGARALERSDNRVRLAIPIVLILFLGALTLNQTKIYESPMRLWRETLDRNPTAWMAHNNLGVALINAGRLDDALVEYKESLRLNPDDADTLGDIGLILARQAKPLSAIIYYRRALQISPGHVNARYNLAMALNASGKREEAIIEYRKVLIAREAMPQAHKNLALLLMDKGEFAEAARHFERALELMPQITGYRLNLEKARAAQEKQGIKRKEGGFMLIE
jgi:tetratricopeptide (TPR) repeat protein